MVPAHHGAEALAALVVSAQKSSRFKNKVILILLTICVFSLSWNAVQNWTRPEPRLLATTADGRFMPLPLLDAPIESRSTLANKGDSESFRSYIEEKSESPEAAKADIEDQEAFAKSASEIKDDPTKEANKKYQDMMDKIGLGGVSIKESLGGIFKALGNVVGRVVERATMIKGNISKAVDMNQGSSNQQSERLG